MKHFIYKKLRTIHGYGVSELIFIFLSFLVFKFRKCLTLRSIQISWCSDIVKESSARFKCHKCLVYRAGAEVLKKSRLHLHKRRNKPLDRNPDINLNRIPPRDTASAEYAIAAHICLPPLNIFIIRYRVTLRYYAYIYSRNFPNFRFQRRKIASPIQLFKYRKMK